MSKVVKLKSSDNQIFEVDEGITVISKTIKHFVEALGSEQVIPLSNVDARALGMVVEWWQCKKSVAAGDGKRSLKEFEAGLVDPKVVLDLQLAADYLAIEEILESMAKKLADLIKDMKVEEVREIFGVENDFTPEEEAALRSEYAWAFEI